MARRLSIQDRRAHGRLQGFIPCKISARGEIHPGYLLEASTRGAFVSSRFVPDTGNAVTILLELPDASEPLSLSGTVIRTHRPFGEQGEIARFGIQFSRVSPESLKLVKLLLAPPGPQQTTR